MNHSPLELLTSYLQSRYRLGERDLALSPRAVSALRGFRRPGAGTSPAAKSPDASPAAAPKPSAPGVRPPGGPTRIATPGRVQTPAAPPAVRLEVPPGDKASRLAFIAEAVRQDAQCRILFQRCKNMVFGVGSPDASILFVGEAPGEEEDEQGEPFVGRAGQLLTKMIQTMGLQRSGVYIANVCKFRPDMPVGATGNRKPTSAEMTACLPYLRAQIEVIGPRVIVALGATAVEGLFSLPKASIMSIRGTWKEWEGIPVMPTLHPAYLLRNESIAEKRKVWEDLLQVMEKTGLPISEKQRNFFSKKP